MKLTALEQLTAYRMHAPRWAVSPTSGAGAARHGGRAYCDWRALWFDQRIEPPSWVIGDLVVAAGAKGILFESATHPGGTNLVLFNSALESGDALVVHDPASTLPKSAASWD
jgi:RES domain-containing protein